MREVRVGLKGRGGRVRSGETTLGKRQVKAAAAASRGDYNVYTGLAGVWV